MRQITEFLSTKITNREHLKFPGKPSLKEVEEFMLHNGFEDLTPISLTDTTNPWSIIKEKRKNDNRFFMYYESRKAAWIQSSCSEYWMRFGDYGFLDKDYPVFFVRLSTDGNDICWKRQALKSGYVEYVDWNSLIDLPGKEKSFTDYSDFRKEVIKYFNF